jgi:hypothetical protein
MRLTARAPPYAWPMSTERHAAGTDAGTRQRLAAGSDRVPARPTLEGIEDKWAQRWEEARVVQV